MEARTRAGHVQETERHGYQHLVVAWDGGFRAIPMASPNMGSGGRPLLLLDLSACEASEKRGGILIPGAHYHQAVRDHRMLKLCFASSRQS
jgi:hypothetical protein